MINIGTKRECFFDDYLIDNEKSDAKLLLHKPEIKEITMTLDKPWEGDGSDFFNFFYDKIIRENLKRGISEGLYRTNINFDYSALFYNAAVDFFYSWNGQFNFFEQTATYFFELVKHHLYSIVNIEGRKVLDSYL